jgi:predicted transcriptional regulator
VRQLNTLDTIRETLTESNTCRKILLRLALIRASDTLKAERKMKMNKKEQRMLDKVFNLDCYDQELWVIDNEDFIKNASDEFKSQIKDLNFTTGQSALENLERGFL